MNCARWRSAQPQEGAMNRAPTQENVSGKPKDAPNTKSTGQSIVARTITSVEGFVSV